MKKFDYMCRWFGTAASFALFGLGGLFQSLLIHPLIWLVIRDEKHRQRTSRRVVSGSMALFVRTMKALGVLDYRISGRDSVQPKSNYLIVANHPSLIDIVFLLSVFPDAHCVVKASMAKNPLFRILIGSAGYISNADSVAMLDNAIECLKAGGSIILFPEGTRTPSGAHPVFSRGAAAIMLRSGCDCLPVFIRCSPTTLTRQDRWYHIPRDRVMFEMAIQPPLKQPVLAAERPGARDATRRLNETLEAYFLRGLESNW